MKLTDAIRKGKMEEVKAALAQGVQLDACMGNECAPPLVYAAMYKQPAILSLLLAHGANVNGSNERGTPAITYAVMEKSRECVLALIAAGAALNTCSRQLPHCTPLMAAAEAGQGSIAKLLVEAGADLNQRDPNGNTALMRGCAGGKPRAVKALLQLGADPNIANDMRRTAIFFATRHPKIVHQLLKFGADPNHADTHGMIPLFAALSIPKSPCVKQLLKAGAVPNVQTQNGDSPLFAAVRGRLAPPVRWLLEAGATPEAVCQKSDGLDSNMIKGTTPLMYAAATGRPRIVQLLLQAGADPHKVNSRNQTALSLAIRGNHSKVVDLLQGSRANLSDADRKQIACGKLLRAARQGNLAAVQSALQDGANVEYPDPDYQHLGWTPLAHACAAGKADVVKALLEAGANPNAVETTNDFTGWGMSPLHHAIVANAEECVAALIAKGANVDHPLSEQETPLIQAAGNGQEPMVRMLTQAGAQIDAELPQPEDDYPKLPKAKAKFTEELCDRGLTSFVTEFSPRSAISKAAFKGHTSVALYLLKQGAKDAAGALLAASLGLQAETVNALLQHGVTANVADKDKQCTPLHLIGSFQTEVLLQTPSNVLLREDREEPWLQELAHRQVAIAEALLAGGADLTARNALGRTPLFNAVAGQSQQDVRSVLDDDAKLHQACGVDPAPLTTLLLIRGVDPNVQDAFGLTPLMVASGHAPFMGGKFPNTLRILAEHNADLNAVDPLGRTSLMLACRQGHADKALLLKELGAKVDIIDSLGRSALHYAMTSNQRVVQCLLEAGLDPGLKDHKGQTPLARAKDFARPEIVRLMKKTGVADDTHGIEAFYQAVDAQEYDKALALLTPGIDCHRFVQHRSAWSVAVCNQQPALVRRLLELGADIHAPLVSGAHGPISPDQASALAFTATWGTNDMLATLLAHGADPHRADEQGRTALMVAAANRKWDAVKILMDAGGRVDPLTEVYLELSRFSERIQSPAYIALANRMTQLCQGPPRGQPNDGFNFSYWSIQAEQEKEAYIAEHPSAHALNAEFAALQAKTERIVGEITAEIGDAEISAIDLCHSIGCGAASFIGLMPTKNPLVMVAAIGTPSGKNDVSNLDLLRFLREVQQTNPFAVTSCRRDTLRLRFLAEVDQPQQLAESLAGICPDIIDQGYGSIKKLVHALKNDRQVNIWWD